jgi:hypothetical protein
VGDPGVPITILKRFRREEVHVRWMQALAVGAVATAMVPAAKANAATDHGGAAASPELSVTSRLADRREVAAGTRAYAIGFEDGRFYANGWHTTGEMGGVWTPPLKLLDGVWFGVDNAWVGQATKFTSGQGYVRYDLPPLSGLNLSRTDFAPDGRRGVLFGLTLSNPGGGAKTVTVKVDAHSELMGAYPWGFTTPSASENLPDHGAYAGGQLRFTDDGTLPGGAAHDYTALVAADQTPVSGEAAATGGAYRGPQPGTKCAANDGTSLPSQCDDGPYGNGTGGELRYSVTVPAHGAKTLWVAAAGSDQSPGEAQSELAKLLQNPAGELAAKVAARAQIAKWSQVSLPGDPTLQQAIGWGKQNLADLTQTAKNLQIRWTSQGTQFPPPLGTVPQITFYGAGFPDYPWMFATDGEYTAFAGLALGQFQTVEDHLRSLRDVSDILNNRSGVVAHETVTDGSVYYGHDSQTNGTNDFNTDEIVKFPSIVALVWRWTGDNRFRDEMYDFARRNLLYVKNHLTGPGGWPTGSGNVERPGMGPMKLDNAVYYIRGLYDLADMARAKHDQATVAWTTATAKDLQSRFESTWWDQADGQYYDSLQADGTPVFQKHWIGQTPMEAQLFDGSELASSAHGQTALGGRENSTYSGDRPGSLGLFHTGRGGGADGNGDLEIFSLTTAIQAVGEGNYGRMAPGQQQRYTDANAETMISEPATGGTPDEQPGAMPEIFPSEGFSLGGNISRCWTCRSMFMQAWGNYGTAWPVVHQQLGVDPYLNEGALNVVPQVPAGQPSVQGSNIRLGTGAADVFASHTGSRYTTKVALDRVRVHRLTLGAVLPAGSHVASVTLDGRRVKHYATTQTNRGLEVTARAHGRGWHELVVTAG